VDSTGAAVDSTGAAADFTGAGVGDDSTHGSKSALQHRERRVHPLAADGTPKLVGAWRYLLSGSKEEHEEEELAQDE